MLVGDGAKQASKPRREFGNGGTMEVTNDYNPPVDGRSGNRGRCIRTRRSLWEKFRIITQLDDWQEENPGKGMSDFVKVQWGSDKNTKTFYTTHRNGWRHHEQEQTLW